MSNATKLIVSICDDEAIPAKTVVLRFPPYIQMSVEEVEKILANHLTNACEELTLMSTKNLN